MTWIKKNNFWAPINTIMISLFQIKVDLSNVHNISNKIWKNKYWTFEKKLSLSLSFLNSR